MNLLEFEPPTSAPTHHPEDTAKIASLATSVETLRSQVDSLTAERRALKNFAKTQQVQNQHQQESSNMQERIGNQLKASEEHKQTLAKQLEEAEAQHKAQAMQLNEKVEGMAKENEVMKVQIDVLNNSLRDAHSSASSNDALMGEGYEEVSKELEALKHGVEERVKTAVEKVQKEERVKGAREWGARLKAVKELAAKETEELKALLSAAQASSAAAQSAVDSGSLSAVKKELAEMEAQYFEAAAAQQDLQADKEELEGKLRSLEGESGEVEGERIAALEQQMVGAAAHAKQQEAIGNTMKKQLLAEVDELKAALADTSKADQIAALEQQLSGGAKQQEAAVDSLNQQLASLRQKLALAASDSTAADQIAALEQQMAGAATRSTQQEAAYEEHKKQLADAKQQLAAAAADTSVADKIAALNQQLTDAQQQLAAAAADTSVVDQMSALQSDLHSKEERLAAAAASSDSLTAQLESSASDLFALRAELDASVTNAAALEQQFLGAESEISSVKKQLVDNNSSLNEKMAVALQDCADATNKATQAESKFSEMYASFTQLQLKHAQLLRDYETSSSGSTTNSRQLEEARKMVSILTGKAQDAEETNLALKAQLDQASQENEALANRLERARAESAVKEVAKLRGSITQLDGAEPPSSVGSAKTNLSSQLENVALASMTEEIERVVSRMEKRIASEMAAKLDSPALFSPVMQKLDALMKISSPAPFLDPVLSRLDDMYKVQTEMTPTKLAPAFDGEVEALKRDVAELTKELAGARAVADKSAEVASELQASVETVARMEAELKASGERLATSAETVARMETEMAAMEGARAGADKSVEVASELQASAEAVARMELLVKASGEKLAASAETVARLETEMAAMEAEMTTMAEEMMALKVEPSAASDEQGSQLLKEELEREKADKKAVKKAAKKLQQDVKHLQEELTGLKERWPEVAEAEKQRADPCCDTCSPDLFLPENAKNVQEQPDVKVAQKMAVVGGGAGGGGEVFKPVEQQALPSTPERQVMARKMFEDERKAMMQKAKTAKLEKAKREREERRREEAGEQEREEDRKPAAVEEVAAEKVAGAAGVIAAGVEWKEESETHPLPPFGLDSPVISHLLASWTTDAQKIQYLRLYLQCLTDYSKQVPATFPKGLTLLGLNEEVKDGFLTLVMPMLLGRTDGIKVKVYSRVGEATEDGGGGGGREGEVIYDLRLKILRSVGRAVGGGGELGKEGKESGFQDDRRASGGGLKDRIQMRLNQQRNS